MKYTRMELEAIELAKQIYRLPEGCVGGPLHIVLDDGNVETGHIQWCIDYIESEECHESEEMKELCLRCAEIMLALPIKSRIRVYEDFYDGI